MKTIRNDNIKSNCKIKNLKEGLVLYELIEKRYVRVK